MSIRKSLAAPAFPPINITNLVDIALTLVVVLLMISPFIEQGLEVRLPDTSPSSLAAEKTVILTVAPGRVYYLGGTPVSEEQLFILLQKKKEEDPEVMVVVKGDQAISYGELARVLDTIKKAEIYQVGLATQPIPEDQKRR
ncbi:MAG: biopolymer transporter ExbD [Candidatus Omnitrophica bacterium]|nr:biopolymer transporter ExbD [Candidatus Omnitrophota bacterium]